MVYRGECTLTLLDTPNLKRTGLDRITLTCKLLRGRIDAIEPEDGVAWVKWEGIKSPFRYAGANALQTTPEDAETEARAQFERSTRVLLERLRKDFDTQCVW